MSKPARSARRQSPRIATTSTLAARALGLAMTLSARATTGVLRLPALARQIVVRYAKGARPGRGSKREQRWARAGARWLWRRAPVVGYALAALLLAPHAYEAARQWPEVVGKAQGEPPLVRAPAGPVRIAPTGAEAARAAGALAATRAELAPAAATGAAPAPTRDARPTETVDATPQPVYRVQLASLRNEADARHLRLADQPPFAAVLRDLETVIERANIGGGMFYRVQAGTFSDRVDAEIVCDELQRRQSACVVVRR